jgi:hypothetical protein
MVEVEGLLEAVGEHQEGEGEEEEDEDDRHLLACRGVVNRAFMAWLLFLEHVDSMAAAGNLRDAYSTYVTVLSAVPTVLQVGETPRLFRVVASVY